MKANNIYRTIIFIFISTALVFSASVLKAESVETLSDDVALTSNIRTDVVSYAGEDSDWTIYFRPGIRFGTEDRVISYYDFLVPLYSTDKSVLFFNPRYSFDDRDGYEWNFGIGYRHFLFDDKAILGGNVFYDMRRSYTDKKYNQVGVGVEVLTEWVNGRVNGYVSLSNSKTIASWKDWYFTSTGLAFSQGKEVPMSGVDYELGAKIPYLSDYVETWVYAGGYNFSGNDARNMNGFMARLEVIPTDFLKLNYEIRNDNIRNTEHYGEVSVEIPFSIDNLVAGKNPFEGLGSRFGGSRTMGERLYEQVRRDVDLKLEQSDYGRPTCMCSCLAGDTEYCDMVYVDNSSTTGIEDGSLENPYTTIGASFVDPNVPACKVFVFKGSGPYLESLKLPDDICLWGEGYDMYGMGFTGYPLVRGNVALDPTHPRDRHSFEMGNNTTVMGLQLENTLNNTNNFIVRIQDISDVKLFRNLIANNGMGIVIRNSNNVEIVGNSITLRNNGLYSNVYGIVMTGGATSTTSNVSILDNTIDTIIFGNPGGYMDTGGIMTFSGVVDGVNISNNTITIRNTETAPTIGHGCYGISFEITNGLAKNVVVSGNDVLLYGGLSNTLLDFAEVDNFQVYNNNFSIEEGSINDGDYGVVIIGPTTGLRIHDNEFSIKSGAGSGYGLLFDDWTYLGWGFPALGLENMELYNNTFHFSGTSPNYGLIFDAVATYNARIYGNTFSGVMDTGIYLDASILGGSVIDLGGGALGSPGNNSISGFTGFAVDNNWGTSIKAENNYWGTSTPTGLIFNGPVDYDPYRTTP